MASWYSSFSIDRKLTASSPLHKLYALTTRHIKIHGWHHCKYGMTYLKAHVDIKLIGCTHKMQSKKTKQQVMLTDSRLHHITLLQRWFGHQDELKQACHKGMKWRASHDEQFDVLHTQNGAVCSKLWCVEEGMKICNNLGTWGKSGGLPCRSRSVARGSR